MLLEDQIIHKSKIPLRSHKKGQRIHHIPHYANANKPQFTTIQAKYNLDHALSWITPLLQQHRLLVMR